MRNSSASMTLIYCCPFRHSDAAQPLNRIDIGQVILHAGQVVNPVGIGDELVPVLPFGDFFGAAMMIADVEVDITNLFAVQFENTADYAVGAGMLGSQIEDHLPLI